MAAIAQKDYTNFKRRQKQGIAELKTEGGYKGRTPDTQRNAAILHMLRKEDGWNHIIAATGCSRPALFRLGRMLKREAVAA